MRSAPLLLLAAALVGCPGPPSFPEAPTPAEVPAFQPLETPYEPQTPEGVLMFRGSPQRDRQGIGRLPREDVAMAWRVPVGCGKEWCGVGWTGQPLLVRWGEDARAVQDFATPGGPDVEVVAGALDGKVYFVDLASGEPSRPALRAQTAPIKGTASIDPRGPPLLYVGQGLPGHDGTMHYKVISLINRKTLLDIPGNRRDWGDGPLGPMRGWGAFDSNGAVLPEDDRLLVGGENGLLFRVDLDTRWDGQVVGLSPAVAPATYHTIRPKYGDPAARDGSGRWAAGIESSVAVHDGAVYWTDSIGSLMGMDLASGETVLALDLQDDTDGTPVISVEDGHPYLYVGSEVDLQIARRPATTTGTLRFAKVDLEAKDFAWALELPAWTCKRADKRHDFNGGILATAALGSGPSEHLVFIPTSHEPQLNEGRLLALREEPDEDGNPVIEWSQPLHGPGWSSPATDGHTIVACDSEGWIQAFDAVDGHKLWELQLEGAAESSPVFWDGRIVVGVRGGAIVCIEGTVPAP